MKKHIRLFSMALLCGLLFSGCTTSNKLTFEDENMARVLASAAGVEDCTKLTQEDLDSITTINVGLTSYYDSIADLAKCKNLTVLDFEYRDESGRSAVVPSYGDIYDASKVVVESDERVEQLQKELTDICQSCTGLTQINFNTYMVDRNKDAVLDENGNATQYLPLKDLSFLSKAANLDTLRISYQTALADTKELFFRDKIWYIEMVGTDLGSFEELNKIESLEIIRVNEEQAKEIEAIDDFRLEVEIEKRG